MNKTKVLCQQSGRRSRHNDISLSIKCEDCKKREGIIEFCESVIDWTHGFKQYICRQCYIKRIKKGLKDTQENLNKQEKLLVKEKANATSSKDDSKEKNGR